MAEPRTFYGGEPITGGVSGSGEISAGKYDGPEAHVQAPWDCPACKAHNEGPLQLGCVSCGAGKPGYHVGQPDVQHQTFRETNLADDPPPAGSPVIEAAWAVYWDALQLHAPTRATMAEDLLHNAFIAGWFSGAQNQARLTMNAAPVTVDVAELAPHTKAQRTIIAALELFREQVLTTAEEEIASGEWCSLQEVAELIERLKAQL